MTDREQVRRAVAEAVAATPVFDVHTHLYAPQFGGLNLSGIDELLTYHYLIAELFRSARIDVEAFWALDKQAQADLIWQELFVRAAPVSEATRGVIGVLSAFGLDPCAENLDEARAYFAAQDPADHLTRVMARAGVSAIVMTNDPLDEAEWRVWQETDGIDARFHAALRMDPILNQWETNWQKVAASGYKVSEELSDSVIGELRRFIDRVIERMRPLYLAVSLPHSFRYPEESNRCRLIDRVVLPVCREHRLPFALMIGVRRAVNPALRLAGDGVGRAQVEAVNALCVENPDLRFMVSMLSRENQHELCVSARKFSNLMPFGCWWFLNNPSIIEEITRERLELLGTSFIPQHSDARVLEQLIYKWQHSRRIISNALAESYALLIEDGRGVTRAEIERDVRRMFEDNFRGWVGLENGQ